MSLLDFFAAFAAVFLVLATSLLLTRWLNFKNLISSLLAFFIICFASIVLVCEIASLFKALDQKWVILLLHLILFLIVLRPGLRKREDQPFHEWLRKIFTIPDEFRVLFKKYPLYLVFLILVPGLSLFNAWIGIRVPPNTNDAMIQHLSRVGYWLQHGSLDPWQTPLVLQLVYPPNAQLNILWGVLFTGSDRFAPLVQWMALPFSALAIFGITRTLGWSRERSLLTSLVWMTLPQIVLQSTSTQNDLISTSLTVIALYFLFISYKHMHKKEMLLSALALGLSIGTKQTIFLILPALFLIFIILLLKSSKPARILLWQWVAAVCISFLIFGSYIYLQNLLAYKNPFGPAQVVSDTVRNDETGFWHNGVLKLSRVAYQSLDLTEIPYRDYGEESRSMWLYNQAASIKAKLGAGFFDLIGLDLETADGVENYPKNKFTYLPPLQIQEDITWFGPLMFLLIPALLGGLIRAIRSKDLLSIGLVFIWLSLFVSLNFFKSGWTPNQSRYYVLSVTCTMPLTAILWHEGKKKIFNYLVLFFALVFMVFTILMNFSKPLIGSRSIWNKPYAELRGLQSAVIRDSISKFDELIPQGVRLGLVLSGESFDYPFFGRDFSRELIPVHPASNMNQLQWLRDNNLCYILVADKSKGDPDGTILKLIDSSPGWQLFTVLDESRCKIEKQESE